MREQDCVVWPPRAATGARYIHRNYVHGAAGGGGLLQLPIGKEANPKIVRRPKRILGILSSG